MFTYFTYYRKLTENFLNIYNILLYHPHHPRYIQIFLDDFSIIPLCHIALSFKPIWVVYVYHFANKTPHRSILSVVLWLI